MEYYNLKMVFKTKLFRGKNGFLNSFVAILLIRNKALETHILECSSLSSVCSLSP